MSGEGTVTDTPLKVYPKRRQNAASIERIRSYQKRKWEVIRAVQSGQMQLKSLSAKDRAMVERAVNTGSKSLAFEHVAGISPHPALGACINSTRESKGYRASYG
jgi:hypothetical protein